MRMILATLILAGFSVATVLAADTTAGKAVYDKSCKFCHGADGTANPAVAKMMKVDMKDIKSADVQGMSNDDIKKVVTDGRGKMKSVKTVTGGSLDDVAAYVHSLNWVRPQDSSAPTLNLPATYVNSQAQADRLQLNTDHSFSLQEAGQPYHGTFAVNGDTLEISISDGPKTTMTIHGSNLIDTSKQTWAVVAAGK